MSKQQTMLEVGNSDTAIFDFLIQKEGYIPKFKEISDEIINPLGKFHKNILNEFKMYEGFADIKQVNQGDIVIGTVSQIKEREVIIDIGNKDNVIIDRRGSEEKICRQLKIGQSIEVLIIEVNDNPFVIKGSVAELVRMNVDKKIKTFYENNVGIEGIVKEIIPAGYLIDIEIDGIIIDAFMPNTLADVNKMHDTNILLNSKITIMLETLQQDKGIYVVSRKKYLKTLIPEKIKWLKKQPKDAVYTGHVTGTRDFGIFIQFEDCLTGMIHKANIQEEWRDKINQIVPGTLIDFYIKDIIKNGDQIILTQILKDSLWDTIRVGDNLQGKVISVKPFGALVQMDFDTSGLIQTTYINKNNKKLTEGDIVDVVIISIIRDDRKIYLTFKNDDVLNKIKDKSEDIEKLKQKFNNI
jgi:ribosomal protein S1